MSSSRVKEVASRLERIGWAHKLPAYQAAIVDVECRERLLPPRICVVVVSWQPNKTVVESMRFLLQQRADGLQFIFVDNGSLSEAARAIGATADVFVTLSHNTGAYFSRNVGAVWATAPVILFLEDDGVPAPDLLAAHLDAFSQYDAISVRGRYIPKSSNPLNDLAKHYDEGPSVRPYVANLEGNSSYDANAFFSVGGWDDAIEFGHGGLELGLRLFKAIPDLGKQIYSPDPVIIHDYAVDAAHLERKRRRQAESFARLRGKHPEWDDWFAQATSDELRRVPLVPRPARVRPLSLAKRITHRVAAALEGSRSGLIRQASVTLVPSTVPSKISFPVPAPHYVYVRTRRRNSGLTSVRWHDDETLYACDFSAKKLYRVKPFSSRPLDAEIATLDGSGQPTQTDLMDLRGNTLVVTNFYKGEVGFYDVGPNTLRFKNVIAPPMTQQGRRVHGAVFVPGYANLLWVSYCDLREKGVEIVTTDGTGIHSLPTEEQAQDVAFVTHNGTTYAVQAARTNHITVPEPNEREIYVTLYVYRLPPDLRVAAPELLCSKRFSGHVDALKTHNGRIFAANQHDDCVDEFVFDPQSNDVVLRRRLSGFCMPHGLDIRHDGLMAVTNYATNELRFLQVD